MAKEKGKKARDSEPRTATRRDDDNDDELQLPVYQTFYLTICLLDLVIMCN